MKNQHPALPYLRDPGNLFTTRVRLLTDRVQRRELHNLMRYEQSLATPNPDRHRKGADP